MSSLRRYAIGVINIQTEYVPIVIYVRAVCIHVRLFPFFISAMFVLRLATREYVVIQGSRKHNGSVFQETLDCLNPIQRPNMQWY